jgi:hypothetical protein
LNAHRVPFSGAFPNRENTRRDFHRFESVFLSRLKRSPLIEAVTTRASQEKLKTALKNKK